MTYNRYHSEWGTRISHAVSSARTNSNAIIDLVSPSAAGLNYTNIKLDSALKLYAAAENLLFFSVEANSDFSAKRFGFSYIKTPGVVWKTNIEKDELAEEEAQLAELNRRLEAEDADHVKLTFLIGRAQERLLRHYLDIGRQKEFQGKFPLPNIEQGGYQLNSESQQLFLHLALRNQQKGSIYLFYDAKHLYQLQQEILTQLLKEAITAILFSVILIVWASWWIVRPIKRLATAMSAQLRDVDISNMPELERKDEVGVLARKFQTLVKRTQGQIVELEQLSEVDALTQLGSRFYFNVCSNDYLNQAKRAKQCLGFLICDLDNFKAYNDNLGHPEGDKVLRRVGLSIQSTMKRDTDMAFRLGGEEFVVLLQTQQADDIYPIAIQLCQQLEGLEIEHPKNAPFDVVTMSIGVCFARPDDLLQLSDIDQLYKVADQALYRAKAAGRNAIELTQWTSQQDSPDDQNS
ncbi:sensor domain-containing diguanylate cyclase [Agarivorans litoreus]|uniref:sensor domain-containing diguanylate cyclase n=1 Tax=Agarivorans litoreus TaxID=1510455 RepID=UPI001C7CB8E7|nr:sensor domain-containing diguanylate cyclase [Agarivorans litoreus]